MASRAAPTPQEDAVGSLPVPVNAAARKVDLPLLADIVDLL
ncbi:MAG TPA: hypothetical protein VN284_12565 [Rhizobium sp.]|nr:hypothetical protein [Rhizobium sp.]